MATKAPVMTFKKGDNLTQYFQIPVDSYTVGSVVSFAAKPKVDNDTSDAAAVIDKTFTDLHIVAPGDDYYLAGYVTWQMDFTQYDIANVSFNDGEKKKKYLGEFQMISPDAVIQSFPSDDNFIDVIIYADIRRAA